MRLIDADTLGNRFAPKQCYFTEDILYKIATSPTVDAAPLDKLCEWLDYHAGKPLDCVGEQCIKCKFGVTDSGDGNCWKAMLTKWMEGLDAK